MPDTPLRSTPPRTRHFRHSRHPRRGIALLLAVLLGAPLAAGAADSEGRFAVKGAGATTCADYAAAFDERGDRLYAYGGWLEGYLTAANQTLEDTFDLTSWETPQTLAVLLVNHCRRNPEVSFLDATRLMFQALHDARIKSSSELVVVRDGERGMRMYRETLQRVQTRLAENGLYKGAVDGTYNEATRAAMRTFQQQSGLEENGMPDQATLMQLLRTPPA